MLGKLDPAFAADWQNHYRAADKRRRLAGWHRRSDASAMGKGRKLDASRALAIVMGLAAVAVLLCVVIPL